MFVRKICRLANRHAFRFPCQFRGDEEIDEQDLVVRRELCAIDRTVISSCDALVQPDIRAMFSWKTSALIDAIQKTAKGDRAADNPLQDFLNRVYSQTHNLGLTSQDRAINFAATDALMNAGIFRKVRKEHAELEFDSFSVERSPICRADADCWDVVLYFYDPTNLMRARRAIRYTIDVADVVPIIVGEQREYSVR